MTVNIHNKHNKLSIVGDAKWQVRTVGADRRSEQQSGNLGKNVTNRQTDIHFIIIYISAAWQGEGKISNNVTNTQTYRHFTIIYISAAWQEKTK